MLDGSRQTGESHKRTALFKLTIHLCDHLTLIKITESVKVSPTLAVLKGGDRGNING